MTSTGQAKSNQANSFFLPPCCLTKYLQNLVQLHVAHLVQQVSPCSLPFAFSPHFYESRGKWSVESFYFSVLSELSGPTHLNRHCRCLWKAPYCTVISSALPPDSKDILCALKSLIQINRDLSYFMCLLNCVVVTNRVLNIFILKSACCLVHGLYSISPNCWRKAEQCNVDKGFLY